MSNPSKEKGTKAETRVVRFLQDHGIGASRKALTGSNDCGDIDVIAFGYGSDLVFEVKSGKQTLNPSRKQLDEWMRQTIVEGKNAGCDAILVVARHGKNPADYDVWVPNRNSMCLTHWYLDDWCKFYKD